MSRARSPSCARSGRGTSPAPCSPSREGWTCSPSRSPFERSDHADRQRDFRPDADQVQGCECRWCEQDIQYDISGDGGGTWHAVIKDGACTVNSGAAASAPDLTVTMASSHLLDMIGRKL